MPPVKDVAINCSTVGRRRRLSTFVDKDFPEQKDLPMPTDLRFDKYLTYAEITGVLHQMAETYPHLIQIQSIGQSHEGRDIWCATVTRFATGPAEEKPAFWVDANIHATELSPSSAALYLLHKLVGEDGTNAEVTRALDTRAFYVVPRVNPDGAELAMASPPMTNNAIR